jgi:endonuclease YncB( thermonuclease family)
MTDEPDKAGKGFTPMKGIFACVFGLLLVGCGATLPPPTSLAVLIALSSPTPTLISDYDPTWQPPTITGKVVGVSDGDTITVLDDQKRQHKIRLDGIDAPKSNQDYGSRAKQSLSDLVFGKTVTVTISKEDKYGCLLGQVTLDFKNINREQISRGMAWFYRFYAQELRPEDARVYEQAEAQARKERRGLWADASPTPPWDFRRGKTAKASGLEQLSPWDCRPSKTAKAPSAMPPAPATGQIIGNRNSKIYHLSNCPDYSKVLEKNRAPFKSEAEAQAAGYRKAKNCP